MFSLLITIATAIIKFVDTARTLHISIYYILDYILDRKFSNTYLSSYIVLTKILVYQGLLLQQIYFLLVESLLKLNYNKIKNYKNVYFSC